MSDEKTGSPSGGPVFFCTFVDANITPSRQPGAKLMRKCILKLHYSESPDFCLIWPDPQKPYHYLISFFYIRYP